MKPLEETITGLIKTTKHNKGKANKTKPIKIMGWSNVHNAKNLVTQKEKCFVRFPALRPKNQRNNQNNQRQNNAT
jgi:hypothetical protein